LHGRVGIDGDSPVDERVDELRAHPPREPPRVTTAEPPRAPEKLRAGDEAGGRQRHGGDRDDPPRDVLVLLGGCGSGSLRGWRRVAEGLVEVEEPAGAELPD